MLHHLEEVMKKLEFAEDTVNELIAKLNENEQANIKLADMLETLRAKKTVLISYMDLAPEGKLADFVNDFTYFSDFETNDAFLDMINY